MNIIEAEHLSKSYIVKEYQKGLKNNLKMIITPQYQKIKAVDDLNFSVKKGECVGYVGPNGSGKSTTIKMMCGILRPSNGKLKVNGRIPSENRIENSRDIGVVFGNRSQLWWDVPIIESFNWLKNIYDIPNNVFKENLSYFTEILHLENILKIPERQLSLGQRVKCNVAAAFLHNPQIVFLDEPTIGLDIEAKEVIRAFIRKINNDRKVTFLITSHDFDDIESLCNRIILLNKGNIIMDKNIKLVAQHFNNIKCARIYADNTNVFKYKYYKYDDGINVKVVTNNWIELEYDLCKIQIKELIDIISKDLTITDIEIRERKIEEMISDVLKISNKEETGYEKSTIN